MKYILLHLLTDGSSIIRKGCKSYQVLWWFAGARWMDIWFSYLIVKSTLYFRSL